MKILMGLALIASQALAGPIVDTNPALLNKLNERKVENAKAIGVTLTPSVTNSNGLTNPTGGGLNNAGSFYKATTLNGVYNGATGSAAVAGAGAVKCKSQAEVDNDFKTSWSISQISGGDWANRWNAACSTLLQKYKGVKEGATFVYIDSICEAVERPKGWEFWMAVAQLVYKKDGCPSLSAYMCFPDRDVNANAKKNVNNVNNCYTK